MRGFGGPVVEARGDDANRAGHERRRARAGDAVPRHIIHFAMAARREPVHEPHFLGFEIGIRDADRAKTEFASPRDDARRERGRILT